MLDLNKTLQVIDHEDDDNTLAVKIVDQTLGGDFPLLAVVGSDLDDPEDQTIVRFSTDGDSRKGRYTLQNVPEPKAAVASGDATGSGKIELPVHLQAQVRHRKYGYGKIVKVRPHADKSTYVAFDDGKKKWVFDRKLTLEAGPSF